MKNFTAKDFNRVVMLLRCPGVSDGARITLVLSYLNETKGDPLSYRNLAGLLGVTKQCVINHFKDSIKEGLIQSKGVDPSTGNSKFLFLWNEIAQKVGFTSERTFNSSIVVSVPLPKNMEDDNVSAIFDEVQVRIKPPKTVKEFMQYFASLYRAETSKKYKGSPFDINRIRVLLRQKGPLYLEKLIKYYCVNRGRLCVGEFCIETLFDRMRTIEKCCPE